MPSPQLIDPVEGKPESSPMEWAGIWVQRFRAWHKRRVRAHEAVQQKHLEDFLNVVALRWQAFAGYRMSSSLRDRGWTAEASSAATSARGAWMDSMCTKGFS
jgi:hypothetical protein